MELRPATSMQLSVRPQQRIHLGVNMRQSLRVLQMPRLDLKNYLEEEISENPFLEQAREARHETLVDFLAKEDSTGTFDNESRERTDPDRIDPKREATLLEHLLSQWNAMDPPYPQSFIGRAIIEDLDENGYLVSPLERIAAECSTNVEDTEQALEMVQQLDPEGIACRDLRECLLNQLQKSAAPSDVVRELADRIVRDHLSDIAAGRTGSLAEILSVTEPRVQAALKRIRAMNPRPGALFGTSPAQFIAPDVVFHRRRKGFEVVCEKEDLPDLKIHPSYKKMLNDPRTPPDARQYLREKLTSAMMLLSSFDRRQKTIVRIARCLAVEQSDFILKGPGHLKSLRMDDLAKTLRIHKSTVSRAVADKYAQTPRGLVQLKAFFGGGRVVHGRIREIVKKENKKSPLSDARIAELLSSCGKKVSRRTVVKYRRQLSIPASYVRKKLILPLA